MAKSKKHRQRRPETPRNPLTQPPTPSSNSGGRGNAGTGSNGDPQHDDPVRWWREAIESIVVAIVLALLFRAFEAEAFVIPTGSMAPTLQGQHKDLRCEFCNKLFRSGASREVATRHVPANRLTNVICPMCHGDTEIDTKKPNHDSFSGDRILVNKWIYQFSNPRRWDVIVFKFPGNAKQNYIKRLVGLPGEQLKIYHGDIYVRSKEETEFTIANKEPRKQLHTMQLVHDSRYVPQKLIKMEWPSRWHSTTPQAWQAQDDQSAYQLGESTDEVSWLRYRHLIPTLDEWRDINRNQDISLNRKGELITDFYEYNESILATQGYSRSQGMGFHWVGDLAVEGRFRVEEVLQTGEGGGELLLDLVEAGRHHTCRIDTSDGAATVTIDDGGTKFSGGARQLTAMTSVTGEGQYDLRFSNVDDQLRLWVGGKLIQFKQPDGSDHDGKYTPTGTQPPTWSPTDPGDLEPLGIGARNLLVEAMDLRVWRDVYYIATRGDEPAGSPANDYGWTYLDPELRDVFTHPERWSRSSLFQQRRAVEFPQNGVLGPDQFFPMGDNSPASKDARLWHADSHKRAGYDHPVPVPAYVEREQLIGKAFFVYWPHTWKAGTRALPVIPNIPRMGTIR